MRIASYRRTRKITQHSTLLWTSTVSTVRRSGGEGIFLGFIGSCGCDEKVGEVGEAREDRRGHRRQGDEVRAGGGGDARAH